MSRLAKVSKYRHTTATAAKNENTWRDLKVNNSIWDCSALIAANHKWIACHWAGSGAGKIVVFDVTKPLKSGSHPPAIAGHSAGVIDWTFHPYNPDLLVTGSEDCTIKVWQVPEGGLTSDLTEAAVTHTGHGKKVGILSWHPSANHVLASASLDHTVKLWDVENGLRATISCHTEQIASVNWNLDGSMINTTSKDKKLRIIDPRSGEVTACVQAHEGSKTQRSIWAKRRNQIVTVGFSKKFERQLMVWDPKKLTEPLHTEEIDSQSGVLMPYIDEDTNMMYLGGKGDGNIRSYELWEETTPITELDCFSSSNPAKGLCLMPKTSLDIRNCEVAKIMKLEINAIVPISFKLPRKTAQAEFQADVFPPTFALEPAMTAGDFFAGKNAEPKTIDMEQYWAGTAKEVSSPTTGFSGSSEKLLSDADIKAAEAKVEEAERILEKAVEELDALKEKKKEQDEGKPASPAAKEAPKKEEPKKEEPKKEEPKEEEKEAEKEEEKEEAKEEEPEKKEEEAEKEEEEKKADAEDKEE
ncbi:Coronin-A [Diplonema papillatum]|nr:Coronin-A [Diplonema papillatum]